MNPGNSGRSPYFVNVWVDVTLIGGLSILTALVFWACTRAGIPTPGPSLSIALAWIVNWPHFSASSYRLYRSRANVLQYPMTSLAIPLLVGCAVVGSFLSPQTAGAALIKLYMLWSPYHFSGQSMGLSLLYARRNGATLGPWERGALSTFYNATWFALVLRRESATDPDMLGDILFPSLGIPSRLADAADVILAISGMVLLAVAIRRRLPFMVLLPALTQLVWFQGGARLLTYNFLVPFFHSLQYLLIVWAMQLSERKGETGASGSAAFIGRETLKWMAINIAGGAALFWLLPRLGTLAGRPLQVSLPIFFAAVQIHHFFVDGVIWKLRNPAVRSPLLVDLDDLRGRVPAAARGAAP